jgi:ankyrin repeat protein
MPRSYWQKRMTAVMLAAQHGQLAMVNFLLSRGGVDVSPLDADGVTALLHAVTLGDTALVQTLLGVENVTVTAAEPDYRGRTSLIQASFKNDLAIMDELLEAGAVDVNACMPNGMTALMTAAARGYGSGVRMLLKAAGIRVNATDARGYTALLHAVVGTQIACSVLLIEHSDVDVNCGDLKGVTPLMHVRSGCWITSTMDELLCSDAKGYPRWCHSSCPLASERPCVAVPLTLHEKRLHAHACVMSSPCRGCCRRVHSVTKSSQWSCWRLGPST